MLRSLKANVCLADLVEHIRNGDFPEWDFQIQTMKPEEQEDFWFDPLDNTKVSSYPFLVPTSQAWLCLHLEHGCISPCTLSRL